MHERGKSVRSQKKSWEKERERRERQEVSDVWSGTVLEKEKFSGLVVEFSGCVLGWIDGCWRL